MTTVAVVTPSGYCSQMVGSAERVTHPKYHFPGTESIEKEKSHEPFVRLFQTDVLVVLASS